MNNPVLQIVPAPVAATRAARLRAMLNSPQLEFLIEAHNGISAKIAAEAGFAGIWASGFAMSASLGLPDNNEASCSEILNVVEYMTEATEAPILVDGDTGYGDHNNVQRLVRKLEQRKVAGLCIEDKVFPKRNSFINGRTQQLAAIGEFCGKIHAAKDAQDDCDFVVVARVEALIAGHSMDEALLRAYAYADAGADAILIHSAKRNAEEVLAFKSAWRSDTPVVIVPTKYYSTPTDVFADVGFSLCIWANHLLRASVTAMQQVATQIRCDRNLLNAEATVAPMAEIFRLQNEGELAQAERRYCGQNPRPRVLLLAASRGVELGELTQQAPKTMLRIGEQPLLGHIVAAYGALGLSDVIVVRGYQKQQVNVDGPLYVDNDAYDTTGEAWSLWMAREWLAGECVVSYGDVLFRKHIPVLVLDCADDFVICVDTQFKTEMQSGKCADLVTCSEAHARGAYHRRIVLRGFTGQPPLLAAHGEWMGILRTSVRGTVILAATLDMLARDDRLRSLSIPDVIAEIIKQGHEVRVIYTTGHWLDVDTLDDVLAAAEFV